MSLIDGTGLIEWKGCLFDPANDLSMELLARCMAVDDMMQQWGGHIGWNEAGRPFGVASDANVTSASQTLSGRSTVWFQWGRYLRGETPSAANPALGPLTSHHTIGDAVDCNAPTVFDMQLRARAMLAVGMDDVIASESWHFQIVGPCSVDLQKYRVIIDGLVRHGNATPIEEDDMFSDDDRRTLDDAKWLVEQIKQQTDKIGRIAVATDLVLWATTDPSAGIRQMIANLSNLTVQLESNDLTKDQVEAALKAALAPFTASSIADQMVAAQARVDAAAAEAAKAAPAQ